MDYVTMENDELVVKVNTFGAEISSVKSKATGTEYIWQADPAFWNRHTPVLFPFVGKLKDGKYSYKGQEYDMTMHGFARDSEFLVASSEEDKDVIRMSLSYSEETLKVFPFRFSFVIEYKLTGNKITVKYEITNLATNEKMYFSVGAHPAFNVPMDGNTSYEDYYLEISPEEKRTFIPITKDVFLREDTVETDKCKYDVSRELFKDGVLIFETPGKTQVALRSAKSDREVLVDYEGMPYLGLWSSYPADSQFVCIEPWCGVMDPDNTNGKLETKKGIHSVGPGRTFEQSYQITFN